MGIFQIFAKTECDKHHFDFTFKVFYEANQILLILRSFRLIEKRIELASLSEDLKAVFEQKLTSFYDCRLTEQLQNISVAVNEYPHLKDEATDEIQSFLLQREGMNKLCRMAANDLHLGPYKIILEAK